MLRGSVYRRDGERGNSAEDAVLHDQLDHPLRLHRRPDFQRLLSAGRLRRESYALHFCASVSHRLLLAALRHHPTDLARYAAYG